MARQILVVDDEELARWSLVERLRADGHEVLEAGTAEDALDRVGEGVDLVLLDHQLPGRDGLALVSEIKAADPDAAVIVLAPAARALRVVDVMKAGALDVAVKPYDLDDVAARVDKALDTTRLRRELRAQRDVLSRPSGLDAIVGESPSMQRLTSLVGKIATSAGSTVLITGEPGTGKALVARVIHYASARAARPILGVACASLSEPALEAVLFGRERGVPGAAPERRPALLEQADGGTAFLEDIGDLSPAIQARLLRFLEERTFQRVGGAADLHADVRIIASVRRNLEEQVRAGKFREDLYYRLNVLRVEMPPLRARPDDVPLLAQHFIDVFRRELQRPVARLSAPAAAALQAYAWPGNVRELRNLVERAVLLAESEVLEPGDFESLHTSHAASDRSQAAFGLPPEGVHLDEVEKSLVMQALERAGGNQTKAAALLGLHRDQIRYRIEKFGLIRK